MRINFKHNGENYMIVFFESEDKLYLVIEPDTDNETLYDVKVFKSDIYTIKQNKKSFSAIDGKAGLFKFFKHAHDENFMESYLWRFAELVPTMFNAI